MLTPDRFDTDRWLEPDKRLANVFTLNLSSGVATTSIAEDWLKLWKRGTLNTPVPVEIINLFEQARACMCYGYFFYPLYALGTEQLTRVADAAAAVRCEQLGAPKAVSSFQKRIDWLAEDPRVPRFDIRRWHGVRHFRNEASHHTQANVIPAAMAAPMLWGLAEDIQMLFEHSG